MINRSGNLETLLAPLEVSEFFAAYWNRRALYLPGPPVKFAGLFDRGAFERGARRCGDLKVGYTDERGWPAHAAIQPEQIDEMLGAGKTVCAGGIEAGDPALSDFLQEYRKAFKLMGRFYFNSYLSPNGGGFGLHLDNHPVTILQVDGRKRWWFSPEPGLPAVLTNVAFPLDRQLLSLPWATVNRPSEQDLREVVLNPGDLLYLPKGTWHRASAIDGSLALTLAMESASPVDVVQYALGPQINQVIYRDSLPGYWVESVGAGIPPELEKRFQSALDGLREIAGSLTAEDLYRTWGQLDAQLAPAADQTR